MIVVSFSRADSKEARHHTHFKEAEGEFSRLAPIIVQKAWSPIVWRGGQRKKDNFLSSDLVALDFDNGEWSIDDAKNFCLATNLQAIIATTKSHQLEKKTITGITQPAVDRFRLVLPTVATCTSLDDFEYTMRMLMDGIPCDASCKDGGRFYFPCKEVVWSCFDESSATGKVQWMSCPEEETEEFRYHEKDVVAKEHYRDATAIPHYLIKDMRYGVKSPGRHKALYMIGCELGRRGFTEREIMQMLTNYKSPLLEIDDAQRCVGNGIERISRGRGERQSGRGSSAY